MGERSLELRWTPALIYNLVVLGIYAYDKRAARRGWRRVPEAKLLWLAALAGGPGAFLGIFLLRHKTRKPRFALGVPLLLAAQVAALFAGRRYGLW